MPRQNGSTPRKRRPARKIPRKGGRSDLTRHSKGRLDVDWFRGQLEQGLPEAEASEIRLETADGDSR